MKLTPEARKTQLLDTLTNARNTILAEASALSPAQRREPFLGTWNTHDLIAHLIGWDYTNIQAAQDILGGQLPRFYDHHDHDWRTYNAHLVQEYGTDDWAELLAAVAESHRQLVATFEALPAEAFDRDRGLRYRGWKVTIARLLEADIKDVTTHAAQVMAFKNRTLMDADGGR